MGALMGALFPTIRPSPGVSLLGIGGEPRRIERVLATVRIVLAVSALVAIYYDSTQPRRYAGLAYALLLMYVAYAIGIYTAIRRRPVVSSQTSLGIHAVDILFPSIISLFTQGPNSPFFLFFGFVLLAAAYRWGMNKTLLTGAACIAVLLAEAVVLRSSSISNLFEGQYDLNTLIMRAAYLAIFAFLIGYLAEQEKRLRAQAFALTSVSSKARFELGLKGTLRSVLHEIVQLFRAQQAVLAFEDATGAFLWKAGPESTAEGLVLTWRALDASERSRYFFALPADTFRLSRTRGGRTYDFVSDEDSPVARPSALPASFSSEHPFRIALVNSFAIEPAVSARLFLFEPHPGLSRRAEVRFLRDLIRHVAPAVYNIYLLRRLRSRAAADERARVARDLHDGVIQSLHAIAFRLYALRIRASRHTQDVPSELLDIQQLVQREVSNLRQLIQQLKPVDFDPNRFVEWLSTIIDQYRQDTGIGVRFISDVRELVLPVEIAREVAHIVREALVNVARHSGAEHVVVRLSPEKRAWKLSIDDDGKGFQFVGRFSLAQLENNRHGPTVIKERVKALGGELTIDSRPGRGARLEIIFPQVKTAAHA
jgi:signal transduction histidine kinase